MFRCMVFLVSLIAEFMGPAVNARVPTDWIAPDL